jgi:hypothetical protein
MTLLFSFLSLFAIALFIFSLCIHLSLYSLIPSFLFFLFFLFLLKLVLTHLFFFLSLYSPLSLLIVSS